MGGRGKSAIKGGRQFTIEDHAQRMKIDEIVRSSEKLRDQMALAGGAGEGSGGSGAGVGSPLQLYKKCACCEQYCIPVKSKYEMCKICGWIDDPYQNAHPDSLDGRNPISLIQAKKQYGPR